MSHTIHRVVRFQRTGPFALRVWFDDGTDRVIDFAGIVGRGFFGPLADPAYFARAMLDAESGTLVWPNGADFDPETLHDWPTKGKALVELAAGWSHPT